MTEKPVRRAYLAYLLSVMFITLFTTAGAGAQMGRVVAREADDDVAVWAVTVGTSFVNFSPLVEGETHTYTVDNGWPWSELLRAALIGVLGAAIFEFHRRRWRDLLRRESGDG